jgi:hypothetical protein
MTEHSPESNALRFNERQIMAIHKALRRRLRNYEPPVEITANKLLITIQVLAEAPGSNVGIIGWKEDVETYLDNNRDLGFVEIEKGEERLPGRQIWILHPTEEYEGGGLDG